MSLIRQAQSDAIWRNGSRVVSISGCASSSLRRVMYIFGVVPNLVLNVTLK
jgi:hypothetical protein